MARGAGRGASAKRRDKCIRAAVPPGDGADRVIVHARIGDGRRDRHLGAYQDGLHRQGDAADHRRHVHHAHAQSIRDGRRQGAIIGNADAHLILILTCAGRKIILIGVAAGAGPSPPRRGFQERPRRRAPIPPADLTYVPVKEIDIGEQGGHRDAGSLQDLLIRAGLDHGGMVVKPAQDTIEHSCALIQRGESFDAKAKVDHLAGARSIAQTGSLPSGGTLSVGA